MLESWTTQCEDSDTPPYIPVACVKIFQVTIKSLWLHLSTLLCNEEVASTVLTGAGAQSALSHLFNPYVTLGIRLRSLSQRPVAFPSFKLVKEEECQFCRILGDIFVAESLEKGP